jgi:hypothetical protein
MGPNDAGVKSEEVFYRKRFALERVYDGPAKEASDHDPPYIHYRSHNLRFLCEPADGSKAPLEQFARTGNCVETKQGRVIPTRMATNPLERLTPSTNLQKS